MAFSELELKEHDRDLAKFMERRRPPEHIRAKLDFGYRITGQSVEIFEVTPDFRDASKRVERSVAKATYVRAQNVWRVFWKRADGKWHAYEPNYQVGSLHKFLAVVHQDAHGCFFD